MNTFVLEEIIGEERVLTQTRFESLGYDGAVDLAFDLIGLLDFVLIYTALLLTESDHPPEDIAVNGPPHWEELVVSLKDIGVAESLKKTAHKVSQVLPLQSKIEAVFERNDISFDPAEKSDMLAKLEQLVYLFLEDLLVKRLEEDFDFHSISS